MRWRDLAAREAAGPDDPVFRSCKGGPLDTNAVHRVVKAVAARAGLAPAVSAHWLRHAHASHALDRGAPVHLFQATLGHVSVATTGRYLHARPSDSLDRYVGVRAGESETGPLSARGKKKPATAGRLAPSGRELEKTPARAWEHDQAWLFNLGHPRFGNSRNREANQPAALCTRAVWQGERNGDRVRGLEG
ncbi:tyrosine-type recombinase/integrase [Methylobacterium nigriterrae]|uniref:tyrosine-type recombinase/integrase n=1 Tax=Methylobacterium nigriterrae TaxID=3127512 RepID=UPI003013E57E